MDGIYGWLQSLWNWETATYKVVVEMSQRQERIESLLNQLVKKQAQQSAGEQRMGTKLDEILVKVAAEKTADDSMIALLAGLKQQIADAAGDPVKLQAISDSIDANLAEVNAALASGVTSPVTAPPIPVLLAAAAPNATPDTVAAAATSVGVTDPAVAAAVAAPDATAASVASAVAAVTP